MPPGRISMVTAAVAICLASGCPDRAPLGTEASTAGGPGGQGGTGGEGGPCGAGMKLCADGCVSTDNPTYSCGAETCTQCALANAAPTCKGGACAPDVCASGWDDCNTLPEDGCEADLTDEASCGSCSNDCGKTPATPFCNAGICGATKCERGTGDCDGNIPNGCETNTASDVNHCGLCTVACKLDHATAGCAAGACIVTACGPGYGDCNTTAADGCEIELVASADHCAACGHSCLGAACVDGACQPIPIAVVGASTQHLAVDDTWVYWTVPGDDTVRRKHKDGTGGAQTLATGQAGAWGIFLDGAVLYFAKFAPAGGVGKVDTDGTNLVPLVDEAPTLAVAVVGGWAYYTLQNLDVKRVPIVGGAAETLASNQSAAGIATDGTDVYWTKNATGEVIRYAVGSGMLTPLTAVLDNPAGILVDDDYIFYSEYLTAGGDVGRMDKTGGNVTVLQAGQAKVSPFMGMDKDYVYWTTEVAGTVMRAAKDGSGVTTLATNQITPRGVTADAVAVYWATYGPTGTIYRLAK